MSDEEISGKVEHFIQLLQTQLVEVASRQGDRKKNGLRWGQFVVSGNDKPQVGVYGSSCAAIILSLNRDDDVSRKAVQDLEIYVRSEEAELELSHNIKLALMCLALLPREGSEASDAMTSQLKKLTDRYQKTTSLWPAFSESSSLQNSAFPKSPSPVASAVIVIVLCEIRRRLSHQAHLDLQGSLSSILDATAKKLINTLEVGHMSAKRYGGLLSTAIILVKGRNASSLARSVFSEAVQKIDFADRRVFFYDCLRTDGSIYRDYFIIPAAIVLPMVVDNENLSAMQRARAFDVTQELFDQIDDKGVFKGGQELPSTVEQGLVALALVATARASEERGFGFQMAKIWLNMTQPNSLGKPTVPVTVLVVILWIMVTVILLGKYTPESWKTLPEAGVLAKLVYDISISTPAPIAQFLPFLAGVWPSSRSAFMRLIKRRNREYI